MGGLVEIWVVVVCWDGWLGGGEVRRVGAGVMATARNAVAWPLLIAPEHSHPTSATQHPPHPCPPPQVPATEWDALKSSLMGLFEKRRAAKFLG